MRIRRSPRDMSLQIRGNFIDAIIALKKKLQTLPDGTNVGRYDQHVAIHLGVTGRFKGGVPMQFNDLDGGHGGPGFLPWHREYLLRIENDMNSTPQSKVSLPYWDWTDRDTTFDVIFQDNFLGKYDNSGRHIVSSARFASDGKWKLDQRIRMKMIIDLVFDPNAAPPEWGDDLERNFLAPQSLPNVELDNYLLNLPDFDTFREAIESGDSVHRRTHNYMHGWVGGVMGSHASPYDPIFLLNHTYIDRIWALWQALGHYGPDHYTAIASPPYGHGLNDPMWPWDGGDHVTTVDRIEKVLFDFDTTDRKSPNDVLNCKTLGYSYVDWSRVKTILDNAIKAWADHRAGVQPRLTVIHGGSFSWKTRDELLAATARGRPLVASDLIGAGKGYQTNLVKSLRYGFPNDNIRQMPAGGPHIALVEIAEIAHWIDMGCPDDNGNPV